MKNKNVLIVFGLGGLAGALLGYALARRKTDMPRLKIFDTWQAEIAKERGEVEAAVFVGRVRARYTALYIERPRYENAALRKHLEQNILPGLALYQELLASGLEQDEALKATEELFFASMEPARRQMENLGRLPFFYNLLRALIPWMMKEFPPEGWDTEWVEVSDQRVAFNMHACFYLETLKSYGAPELTPVYCNGDDYMYKDAWPTVRFERTQTMGKGGELCDFCFQHVLEEDIPVVVELAD